MGENNFFKKLAYLYFIKCKDRKEEFLKIGITSKTVNLRFSGKIMPYKYDVLLSKKIDLGDAYEIEQGVINKFKKNLVGEQSVLN